MIGGGVVAVAAVGAVAAVRASAAAAGRDAAANAGDASAGGGVGQGDERRAHPQLDRVHRPDRRTRHRDGRPLQRRHRDLGRLLGDFNDNNEVYAKEFAAYLDAGNPTPYDIAMPTYWMAARLKNQGWLGPAAVQPDPQLRQPRPQLPRPRLGPGRQVPPAVAGRLHRHRLQPVKVTGRELTEHQRPLRPRVQGQGRDLHRDARHARPDDARPGQRPVDGRPRTTMNQALDKIEEADQRAARSAASPATTTSRTSRTGTSPPASPGPATSPRRTNPDVQFVFPEEGAMSVVRHDGHPDRGAPTAVAAAKWMNFVYDPVNAAQITAYVQYVSPGRRACRRSCVKMGGDAAALADSPLLFPDDATKARHLRRSPTCRRRARPADHRPLRHRSPGADVAKADADHRRPDAAQRPLRAVRDVAARRCCACTCSSSSRW